MSAELTPEAAIAQLKTIVALDDKNAKDLSTKADRVADVLAFFAGNNMTADSPREHKVILFSVWTKVKSHKHRDVIAAYVTIGKIDKTQKADAAIRFVNAIKNAEEDINAADLEKECGAGIVVSNAEARHMVADALKAEDLKELKASWEKNPNMLLGKMRRVEGLRWAEPADVKAALDAIVPELVKDVVLEVVEKKHADPTAAHHDKKAVKKCPQSTDFRGIAQGLSATPIGQLPLLKDGSTVYILGWAHRVRHQSRMSFVVMRDATGYVQCVFDGETEEFHRESSVAIRATIRAEPKAKAELQPALELHVEEYSVIGKSDGSIETIITPESSVDKLLDQRHIVLRGTYSATTLKIRHEMLRAFREFFWGKDYYEVAPPTMVQTQCEGGSTLFDVLYYTEKAYMTQSSQLYLETVTASLGNVYCCLPSYRAEKSKTKRHLSEYTHMEVEYAICTFEDLISNIEDIIVAVCTQVITRVGDLVAFMNPKQVIDLNGNLRDPANFKFMPKKPFRRVAYADAIKFCNEHSILNPETGKDFVFGEDITDQPERAMVALMGEFVLMTHFPVEMKSFYMARDPANPHLTESVDVLAPGVGEIIGGSMRMWDYDELMAGYAREGLDPSIYYWYTDQRKFGSTPHGGFGLGVERFLVWMLDLDSVKEACMFPRYMGRCTP